MSLVSKNIKEVFPIFLILLILGILIALIYLGVMLRKDVQSLQDDVSELKSVLRHISIQLSQDKNLVHSFYKGFKNDIDEYGKDITKWLSSNY